MGGTLAFVLLVKVSVTIFMKLDTHHILKLLSSEHVTTFKRKLGILVTKLKLQVNVFKFCHQYQWGEFHVFLVKGSQKWMITVQLIRLDLMSEERLVIIYF